MDKCLNCGNTMESILWGAKCNCDSPNVVHIDECDGCGQSIGHIGEDDYCGPEKLYCPDCVKRVDDLKAFT